MRHVDNHDPITDWPQCWTCHQAFSAAIARLADLALGPDQVEKLIRLLREMAFEAIDRGKIGLASTAHLDAEDYYRGKE